MADSKLSDLSTITVSDTTLFYATNAPGVSQGKITGAAVKAYSTPTNITGSSGTVNTINGRIAAGTNVTLTGTGTAADPYTIAAAGGGGGSSTTLAEDRFTATAGQTVYTLSTNPVYVQVFQNGVYQPTNQYTRSGATLTLNSGASAGTIIAVEKYDALSMTQYAPQTAYSVLSNNTGSTAAPVANQALVLGTPSFPPTGVALDITGSFNSTFQAEFQNTNTGAAASGDVVVTADTGTDSTQFINMGINNSGYNQASWTVNGPLDGYLYASDGALAIGTMAAKPIVFFTGGTLAANIRAQVDADGAFRIPNAYSPTQTLTDAATITWDERAGNSARVTLGGNRTLALPTNIKDGGTYNLFVIQDATGGRTLTGASGVNMVGTLGTAANQVSVISFVSSGTALYGVIQAF